MKKFPMRALKSMVYAGRRLKQGEPFEARGERDAKLLAAIKSAIYDTHAPVIPVATSAYNTRAMSALTPAAPRAAAPVAAPVASPAAGQVPEAKFVIKVDGADMVLDDLDIDELRALAARLGVKHHHMAGERRIRDTLVESQAAE